MIKKSVIAVGIGLISGSLYAACMGPFCWDDQGAYIGGTIVDGNGTGTPSLTKALMNAATPRATGQEIFCSDCTTAALCVSSGTSRGAYVVGVATGPFTAASYPHCS